MLHDKKKVMPTLFMFIFIINIMIAIGVILFGIYLDSWILILLGVLMMLLIINKIYKFFKYKLYKGFGMSAGELVWNKKKWEK